MLFHYNQNLGSKNDTPSKLKPREQNVIPLELKLWEQKLHAP
jgi:hypothetical protein